MIAQPSEPKPIFKSALLNRLAKSSHQSRANPVPAVKNAFVDTADSSQQQTLAEPANSQPRHTALSTLAQRASNGSAAVVQDSSESWSSEELEDDGGGDNDDDDGSITVVLHEGGARSAVAIDVDAAAPSPLTAWIDLVPVNDLAASLDMSDSVTFGMEHKHVHQARQLSQSLLSHFGSDSTQTLMTQRFIAPLFNSVLRRYTLRFTSDDAEEAFGQMLLAEGASKVIDSNTMHSLTTARHPRCSGV